MAAPATKLAVVKEAIAISLFSLCISFFTGIDLMIWIPPQ